jgi:hypothetical protein
MRRMTYPFLVLLSFGCAQTPELKLRVGSSHTARLAPEVLRQLEASSATALGDLDRDIEHKRQVVAKAQKALTAVRAEPVVLAAAEVHAAKIEQADCELKWEEALLSATEWRRAATAAAAELAKAETLSRTGDDINVGSYADQHDQLRAGLAEALRQQAAKRSRFDESERRLTAAKARYAQTHGDRVVAATLPSPK